MAWMARVSSLPSSVTTGYPDGVGGGGGRLCVLWWVGISLSYRHEANGGSTSCPLHFPPETGRSLHNVYGMRNDIGR